MTQCLPAFLAFSLLLIGCTAGGNANREINTVAENLSFHPETTQSAERININTASFEELQRIPHIGPSAAQKVIEHRGKHGPFRRPEELILVQGISDARFRRIRHLISVE
jgi:competence ComEA-like helix-hairpin-helix protein